MVAAERAARSSSRPKVRFMTCLLLERSGRDPTRVESLSSAAATGFEGMS
jgi:hypothetical protein